MSTAVSPPETTEPAPPGASLDDIAVALAAEAAARVDELDAARALPTDLNRRAAEAGLFRQLVPPAMGGSATTPLAWFRRGVEMARLDASFAWVVTQGSAELAWIAVGGDPVWVAEVLADPLGSSASTTAGAGSLQVHAGGATGRLRGRWAFDTGSPGATWIGGLAIVDRSATPDATAGGFELRICWVPADQATVADDGDGIGLRGTGSHGIAIDATIPLSWTVAWNEPTTNAHGPFRVLVGNGNWMIGASVAAVQLGTARAALDEVHRLAPGKAPAPDFTPLAANAAVQRRLYELEGVWLGAQAASSSDSTRPPDRSLSGCGATTEGPIPGAQREKWVTRPLRGADSCVSCGEQPVGGEYPETDASSSRLTPGAFGLRMGETSRPDRPGGSVTPTAAVPAPDDEREDAPGARVAPTDAASPDDACAALGVDRRLGLDPGESARRLAEVGPNRLAEPPTRPAWRRLVDQFRSALILVLTAAAAMAAIVGDVKDAVVVGVVLVLNAGLGFVQEGRAENAMAALRDMLVTRSRVRRGGSVVEVDADALVPGDVVLLEAGDRIPADGRIVEAVSLSIDESSLTGESVPVDKHADPADAGADLADRPNRGFMNTTVVRGRAELLVTGTGMATEMGRVAGMMAESPEEPTPLQRQLHKLGTRLAMVAIAAVTVVFAARLIQGDDLAEAALGAVALAVAAIPEGLPAVVTVTLAVGMQQLALRQAIVKRLASVETLGSTTVICSDKTGTLTVNQMTAREVVHAGRRYEVSGEGYAGTGTITPDTTDGLRAALTGAVLCNDCSLDGDRVVGDPTEGSLLALAVKAGIDVDAARADEPRLTEIPFDSAHKYMATFHREGDDVVCLVKGAPDVVLDRCTHAVGEHGTGELDAGARTYWETENHRLGEQGLRVIALAERRRPAADALDADGAVRDPAGWVDGLTLRALVGIVDPPRPEARDAIARCRDAGVAVKMITGDHAATAAAIASDLGIRGEVVTGADLDAMTDDELAERVDGIGVCARVSPEHKVRLVKALRTRGHIVAMTGDGVNDAAALRHADIGVAMGITGTEVTKEAADMVLADDNFATIVTAVERGRAIKDNIVKFVRFQLTTNMGAIGTLLGAGLLGLPAPLTAIQVLFVNLIADGPPAMALGIDPPAPGTMQRPPHAPGAPILSRARVVRLLGAAAVMVAGTLGLYVAARERWGAEVGATMAFTTFVLFQVVNVFNARTEHASVFGRATLTNAKLWGAAASVLLIQAAIVTVGPLQGIFATVGLSVAQWLVCAAVAASVLVVEEARKAIGRRGRAA